MKHALALLTVAALALASCQQAEQPASGKPGARPPTAKAPTTAAEAEAPKAPPALSIADWVNSEPLTLGGLKGKVVVLDFWGIFCAPCRKLIPHLNELYQKHRDEGLVVIGITEDRKPDVEEFIKTLPMTYPIAIDKLAGGKGETFEAYEIAPMPWACLIGRDGAIAWQGLGTELTDEMVAKELAAE